MLDILIVELIELIARALHKADLLAVRCVSRYLREATSAVFATAWFTTITIDFTPRSLRRLTNIVQHNDLALAVRCLRVGNCNRPPIIRPLGFHEHDRQTRVLGEGHSWPHLENGCLDLASQLVNDFKALLARFSRCMEICVTDGLDEGSQNDDGARTQLRPVEACYIMFSLLGTHRELRIRSFVIHFDRGIAYDTAARLPPGLADLLAQASWPSHLQHLKIAWNLDDGLVSPTIDIVSTAMCAQSLELSFLRSPLSERTLQLLGQVPQLPALTKLRLGEIHGLTPNTFHGFIERFQGTLKSLRIDNVSPGTSYNTVLGILANQNLPALEDIAVTSSSRVYFCPLIQRQDVLKRCGGRFEFMLRWRRRKNRVSGVRYRGSGEGMRLALQALADNSSYQRSEGLPDVGISDMIDYAREGVGHVVEDLI